MTLRDQVSRTIGGLAGVNCEETHRRSVGRAFSRALFGVQMETDRGTTVPVALTTSEIQDAEAELAVRERHPEENMSAVPDA